MEFTRLEPTGVNTTATFTFANATITANLTAGNVKTDHLLYANGTPYSFSGGGGGSTNPGGSDTQVQYNDGGSFAGSANLTFNKTSNTLTVDNIIANGSGLTSLSGSNVTGQVANALIATTVTANAQPNITSIGTLTGLTLSGNITSGNIIPSANITYNLGSPTARFKDLYLSGSTIDLSGTLIQVASNGQINVGNVSFTSSGTLSGSSITGQVPNSLISGTVYTNAQPNITSVGTLTSLSVTANTSSGNANLGNLVTANYFSGAGNLLSNIQGTNVSGQVGNALVAGTVYTAAQPNITSVGTLSSLTVTANISSGNANLGNLVTANYFTGTLTTGAQPNITSVGTLSSITVTGNVTSGSIKTDNLLYANGVAWSFTNYSNTNVAAYLPTYTGNVAANYFIGNGSALTHITGGNVDGQVSNSVVAGTVYTNAQPNITSVGTLSSLTVSGDSTITGNLTVSGTFEYANVTSFRVKDPIIEQGGNVDGTSLTSNDGKDRGQLLHYYSSAVIDAFMGWDNSNAEFAFGSNVSVTSEVVTFNQFGNVRAGYFLGNASQLTGTIANANYAAYAGNVVTAAQPNITSLGTLTSLTSGLITATTGGIKVGNIQDPSGTNTISLSSGNISVTSNVTASYFIGNGSSLTGQVGNSLVAGTVYTNAQPNITTVGSLSGLTVSNATGVVNFTTTANVTLGDVGNLHITGGTTGQVLTTNGLGGLSWTTVSGGGGGGSGSSISNGVSNINISTSGGNIQIVANSQIMGNIWYEDSSRYWYPAGGYDGKLFLKGVANNTTYTSTEFATVGGSNILPQRHRIASRRSANVYDTYFEIATLSDTSAWAPNIYVRTYLQDSTLDWDTASIQANLVLLDRNGNTTIPSLNTTQANLGPIANVKITGGTTGQVLTTDGAGGLSWTTASGGSSNSITNGTSNVNVVLDGNINLVSGGNTTLVVTSTGISASGTTTLQQSTEVIATPSANTYNFLNGATFYVSGSAANFTPNFTNMPTTDNRVTLITLLINQGVTAYMPTATANVQIDGTNYTVKWQGGSAPTGVVSSVQIVTFMFLRTGATWTVTGQGGGAYY